VHRWYTLKALVAFSLKRVLLLAVMLKMKFGCFFVMMNCVQMMSVRDMSMVGGFLVIAGLMVFGCFLMMASCVLMMFSSFSVMLCCLF
jgi:hypothetical protein